MIMTTDADFRSRHICFRCQSNEEVNFTLDSLPICRFCSELITADLNASAPLPCFICQQPKSEKWGYYINLEEREIFIGYCCKPTGRCSLCKKRNATTHVQLPSDDGKGYDWKFSCGSCALALGQGFYEKESGDTSN